ncbi:MAG TPA: Kdo hydroxylase family protein [Bryobacteraceae bacterium]|nr:Kdo hydroxylase family protein [Bryobacteraceae bacterium]
MEILEQIDIDQWDGPFPAPVTAKAAAALESGKVLFAPRLHFELAESERKFLSPDYLDGKSKNISYRPNVPATANALGGTKSTGAEREELLAMLRRYYERSFALLKALCPDYRDRIQPGFTSFRPAEIAGRASSWRKDDTRLHVDAFPSRPLQGLRILRVFSNVHPTAARMWRVGEPFEQIAKTFLPRISPPNPWSSRMLQAFHITKGRRSPYDHLMLGIHDAMKADERYQSGGAQTSVPIPAGATWACFTDSVPHAAMSGQFAFEQTFYLPVDAMRDPAQSPLRVLERLTGRPLT